MDNIQYQALSHRDLSGKQYIEVRLGKHRKRGFKSTSIYFKPAVFSLFDGIMWDRYREYSPTTTNAISAKDWKRLLEGFDDAILAVTSTQSLKAVKEALLLRSHISLPPEVEFNKFKRDLIAMFESFRTWIATNVANEDYITICV